MTWWMWVPEAAREIFHWATGILVTMMVLVAVIATLANKANRRKRKAGQTVGGSTSEESGRRKLDWTSWTYPIKVIAVLALVFILIAIFWPALWQWFQSQKIFWLAVIVLPLLVAGAGKYKWLWSLAVITAVISLLAADWSDFPANPTDWRLSAEEIKEAAEQRETARGVASMAAATSSLVTTKTIIARPKPEGLKQFRPNAILPFWHQCDWSLSGGCVKVENGRGESVINCPGQKPTGELSASNQLAFWSLESEKEVTVSIVCEPE